MSECPTNAGAIVHATIQPSQGSQNQAARFTRRAAGASENLKKVQKTECPTGPRIPANSATLFISCDFPREPGLVCQLLDSVRIKSIYTLIKIFAINQQKYLSQPTPD